MVEEVVVDMDAEFLKLAGPYRVELLAYCYRLLGSVADAEDSVQETYLRAWRSYGSFEGRSSVRTWLYRIAMNSCLTARARAATRPLPSGLSGPRRAGDDENLAPPDHAMTWLETIPDAALDDDSADPATLVAARAGFASRSSRPCSTCPETSGRCLCCGRYSAGVLARSPMRWKLASPPSIVSCSGRVGGSERSNLTRAALLNHAIPRCGDRWTAMRTHFNAQMWRRWLPCCRRTSRSRCRRSRRGLPAARRSAVFSGDGWLALRVHGGS